MNDVLIMLKKILKSKNNQRLNCFSLAFISTFLLQGSALKDTNTLKANAYQKPSLSESLQITDFKALLSSQGIMPIEEEVALCLDEEEALDEEPVFSFSDLSIMEKQDYILNTYKIDYQTLLRALTTPVSTLDYTEANILKARPDFAEIQTLFEELTTEKINYILARHNLTYEQLERICQKMCREGGGHIYDEVYRCGSTLLNRTHALNWVNEVNKFYGPDSGYNLYNQLELAGQYPGEIPQIYLNVKEWIGYYAILDLLVSEEPSINYTSFRACNFNINGEQFIRGGNKFISPVQEWVENPTLNEVEDIKVYPDNEELTLSLTK